MKPTEMKELLRHIAGQTELVYSKEPHLGLKEVIFAGPADKKAIADLSATLPFALPPSYRQFLELHDGIVNFWADYVLLGTQGESREAVASEVEEAREEQHDDAVDSADNITP